MPRGQILPSFQRAYRVATLGAMESFGDLADGWLERKTTKPNEYLYGRVFFPLRRHYKLSLAACLLSDVIHTLSSKTGWCYASKAYLAQVFDTSERSIQRLLKELVDADLVERRNRKLRTTAQWRRVTGRT